MRQRLLALCLLAYPRSHRERDGDYLRDLALELAAGSGVLRQALSLVRGGLVQRSCGVRRAAALSAAGVAAGMLAIGGVAVAAEGSVDVEVQSCAGQECAAVAAWAAHW